MEPQPRLQAYFDQDYSNIQQQISLFIKGFPIINLHRLSSINDLISQLIKQNSLLATRFKEQLAQVKQYYRRTEAVDLRKNITELTKQIKNTEQDNHRKQIKIEELEHAIQLHLEELKTYKLQVDETFKRRSSVSEMTKAIEESKNKLFGMLNQLLDNKINKNPDLFVDRLNSYIESVEYIAKTHQHQQSFKEEAKQFCEMFIEKLKSDRNKLKNEKHRATSIMNLLQMLDNSIHEFVSRSRQTLKLYQLIPYDKTLIVKYFEGLDNELTLLSKNTKTYTDKAGEVCSGKKITQLSPIRESAVEKTTFEGTVKAVISLLEKNNEGSKKVKRLHDEIAELKAYNQEIDTKSKKQISTLLITLESQQKKYIEDLKLKEELLKYYELTMEEWKERSNIQEQRNQQLKQDIAELEEALEYKTKQTDTFKQQIKLLVDKVEKVEQMMVMVQEEKLNIQKQWEIKYQQTERQVSHYQHELNQMQKQQRELNYVLEQERKSFYQQLENERKTQIELTNNLMSFKQSLEKQNVVLTERSHKLNDLEQQRMKHHQQIDNLSSLIQELEQALKKQGHDLRNKDIRMAEQQKRIANLIEQNSTNYTNLQSLKSQFPDIAKLQTAVSMLEEKCHKLHEQNNSLKSLLKIARTDINESRKKIGQIVDIENQKQQFKIKTESLVKMNSMIEAKLIALEDQNNNLYRQLDQNRTDLKILEELKVERIQLQAELSRALIELKHSKALLGKVEQLRQFFQ